MAAPDANRAFVAAWRRSSQGECTATPETAQCLQRRGKELLLAALKALQRESISEIN